MTTRGPRLEFAVGAFLLLALASLLVLAIASTNGKFGFGGDTYELTARFTNVGPLRPMAPVKIGGVTIGRVGDITLDPVKLDSVVTLDIDNRYQDLSIDTSAGILTNGLLGERSDEHTSELQSLMRISYAVFCLKQKKKMKKIDTIPLPKHTANIT